MPETQRLNTQLLLDAAVTGGYREAFNTAGKLMSDLKRQSTDLRKQLGVLGNEADDIEKIGGAADEVRQSMKLLEKQILHTERATDKFGDAKSHFRSASIGAKVFKSDLKGIADTAKTASLAIAGIGTAAAIALSPDQELLEFDQTLAGISQLSPEIDNTGIEDAKTQIRDLSNAYGASATEIAKQHEQLTRNLGFEGAENTIRAAVEFQTTTGVSVTDIEEELATARISLGIDTPAETREFFELLHGAKAKGLKIDNLDLGDLETLRDRTGEDVFGQNFQREFLTTIAFKQVDSFQYADYATAFKEEIDRAVQITPEMDTKAIGKAQDAMKTLAKWGIRAEDGLVGAMQVYQSLGKSEQVQFFTELEPILTAMPAEVIARGSEALPQVQHQVDMILNSNVNMSDAAKEMANTWSRQWKRIGITSQNSLNIMREEFASVFGVSIVDTAQRFFDFLSSRQKQIRNFFTGVRDTITPVISRVWNTIRESFPDVKQFATDVWAELKKQWDAISPVATFVADKIWAIVKTVTGFMREHPRLVATVITGVAAWKSYRIAAGAVETVRDVIMGATSLASGHIHRLNALIFENIRVQGGLQKTTITTGQKFLTMGKDLFATKFPNLTGIAKGAANIGRSAFAAIPGIVAMGGSLWTATAPILPIVLPIAAGIAGIAAGGYLIHKNWEGIKSFFVDNFNTIRNAMWFVAPPIGFLMTAGQFIKQNWEGVKEFFSTLWETVTLVFQTASELIKFVVLQGALAVKNAWDGMTGFFKDVWDGVTGIFTNSPLAPIFDFMVDGVKKVVRPLFGFFNNFWDNIFEKGTAVINWITDSFKWVNNFLEGIFGWLRKKNDEALDELNAPRDAVIDARLDLPDPVAKVNQELEATIQTQKNNPAVTEVKKPDPTIMEMKQPDPTVAEMKQPDPTVAELKQPAISNEVKVDLKSPTQKLATNNKPIPAPAYSDDMVSIELGILAEARKQTDILHTLVNMKPEILAKYSDVPTVDVKSDIPVVDVPQPNVRNEIAPPVVQNEIYVSPVVNILAPQTDIADTPAPIANIQTPDPSIIAMQTPAPDVSIAPMQESLPKVDAMDAPVIPTPVVQNDISILPPVVNLPSPEKDATLSTDPIVNLRNPDPSIVAMQAPDVSIAQPKEQLPKMDAIDAPVIPTPEIVIPAPVVQNEISLAPPAIAIPAPEKEVAQIPTPIVHLRNPDPTVVDIHSRDAEIAPTPVIPAPTVKNEIAVSPTAVNIITEAPEMPQSIVKNEIAPPVLQNDVSIPPPVDTLQSHQLAVSEIRSPEPTREFLQNYNFPTERTDTPSLIENNPTDSMFGMNRDILVELRKQTDILDVLKPQVIGDIASGAPPDYDIHVMPEIVFDEVDTSPVISSPQTIENSEQVTTHNQTSAPNIENNFTFNVSTQPGQDPETFARVIAEMVRETIDESAETFLIT